MIYRKNKTMQRINETKSCFLEEIKKFDKPFANLSRRKRLRLIKLDMKKWI
jgi:hypothetical protein